jgi:hypothetical protein
LANSSFANSLIERFKEVETGKGADAMDRRPQLAAALKAARKRVGRVQTPED